MHTSQKAQEFINLFILVAVGFILFRQGQFDRQLESQQRRFVNGEAQKAVLKTNEWIKDGPFDLLIQNKDGEPIPPLPGPGVEFQPRVAPDA